MDDNDDKPQEYKNMRARADTLRKLRVLASMADVPMIDMLDTIINEVYAEKFEKFASEISQQQP